MFSLIYGVKPDYGR